MRITLIFLLGIFGLPYQVIGQEKITGVYYGDFITSKNVFVVTINDTLASGSFYMDQFEKFPFQGFFSRNVLKGYFFQNGQPKVITGELKHDSLVLDLISTHDGTVAKHGILARVSFNPKYNVDKLFKKEKPEYDSRLIGSWLKIKSVDADGKNFLKEKYIQEYRANGFIAFSGPAFDQVFANDKTKLSLLLPTLSWETKEGKIIVRSHFANGSTQYGVPEEFIHYYQFSGDTLIVANPKTKEYFIQKQK